jgi:transposase
MRKIRELLRLSLGEGLSRRQVGAALRLPYTTVADHLGRARAAGLSWPLPDGIDDAALEARLFVPRPEQRRTRPAPDFAAVHTALRRKGVTLELLWMEYRAVSPDGYQYSQFCSLYHSWRRHVDVVLRQEHRAGEKLFLDFPGQTVPVVDPQTGVVTAAELFVAVLGASNYTYVEALPSQALPHWIAAHVHAFTFFGGCPAILVPDNLRAGVRQAHRYEPDLNRTYAEMATHYGCAIIPARPYKPRDKAKVEAGVLLVERWIIARLRQRTFGSLVELNVAIRELLDGLNARPFKKLPGSRRRLFEDLDRPALKPLPAHPYAFATWKLARVNIDYHIEVEGHYYSVPYQLAGQQVEVRLTASTVEVFARGRRVASHLRSQQPYRHSTLPEHMPASHRAHLEWTPSRIVHWAQESGPQTAELVAGVLASRPHPEQGYRSCLGILRLGKRYGAQRLEAACQRALALQAYSYRSVESILRTGLDRQPLLTVPTDGAPASSHPIRVHQAHANLRGPGYYR